MVVSGSPQPPSDREKLFTTLQSLNKEGKLLQTLSSLSQKDQETAFAVVEAIKHHKRDQSISQVGLSNAGDIKALSNRILMAAPLTTSTLKKAWIVASDYFRAGATASKIWHDIGDIQESHSIQDQLSANRQKRDALIAGEKTYKQPYLDALKSHTLDQSDPATIRNKLFSWTLQINPEMTAPSLPPPKREFLQNLHQECTILQWEAETAEATSTSLHAHNLKIIEELSAPSDPNVIAQLEELKIHEEVLKEKFDEISGREHMSLGDKHLKSLTSRFHEVRKEQGSLQKMVEFTNGFVEFLEHDAGEIIDRPDYISLKWGFDEKITELTAQRDQLTTSDPVYQLLDQQIVDLTRFNSSSDTQELALKQNQNLLHAYQAAKRQQSELKTKTTNLAHKEATLTASITKISGHPPASA